MITEQAFPFSITYELNGETETIQDVCELSFTGHGGYIDMKERNYEGEFAGMENENDVFYVLSENKNEQTLLEQGGKADQLGISGACGQQFCFSHIALLSGEAVLPMTLIGAVALLDVIVGLLVIPITALVKLIDIEGSSEAWNHQMTYLVPALSLLGVAVSVALRRKGFRRAALILSWIGLIVFALLYISY